MQKKCVTLKKTAQLSELIRMKAVKKVYLR